MLTLNERELATVLAALRNWQQAVMGGMDPKVWEHFEECEPLSMEEIEGLCERLNERQFQEEVSGA